jgi:alpha-beta hydrolase superfamily lysophospholipase
MASNFTPHTLLSPTGAKLAVYTQDAKGTPRGIVHINHGLAEHAGRYAPFAEFLSGRGYHVTAHDHRGHGATTAEDGAPRRFANADGWDKVMGDVVAVEESAKQSWPGLPLVVFGHSMGAVVAFNHVLRQPESIAAAAIWNGNMALGGAAGLMKFILWLEALSGGEFTPSLTLENMTFKAWNKKFPEGRTDADWLSRDTDEVDKYANDPVCGWPSSVSLWRDFIKGVQFAEDDANLAGVRHDLPLHLLGGSKDPATNGGKAVRHLFKRLKKARFTDVELHVLKGFRHETLNEIGREAQMTAFANWLDRVTA